MRVKQKDIYKNFNYLCLCFFKAILSTFYFGELFFPVNANTSLEKIGLISSKTMSEANAYVLKPKIKTNNRLSDHFEDAYFMYSRPMEQSTDFFSQLGEILSISIGGKDKPKFMGLGYKSDTIKWESIAIESLYEKNVIPQRKENKFNNHDIESVYCGSILLDECFNID